MTVYVDPLMACVPNKRWKWNRACHLLADTIDELHGFAQQLGLKRAWFQHKPGGIPHYDLTAGVRLRAKRLGAVELPFCAKWLAVTQGLRDQAQETRTAGGRPRRARRSDRRPRG